MLLLLWLIRYLSSYVPPLLLREHGQILSASFLFNAHLRGRWLNQEWMNFSENQTKWKSIAGTIKAQHGDLTFPIFLHSTIKDFSIHFQAFFFFFDMEEQTVNINIWVEVNNPSGEQKYPFNLTLLSFFWVYGFRCPGLSILQYSNPRGKASRKRFVLAMQIVNISINVLITSSATLLKLQTQNFFLISVFPQQKLEDKSTIKQIWKSTSRSKTLQWGWIKTTLQRRASQNFSRGM